MTKPAGQFTTIGDRRYYEISAYDEMPPFFMTVVSSSDLWLFLSSTGGLTAGRGTPERALFPYVTADQLHRNALHTGSRTWIRVARGAEQLDWEPFNTEQDRGYRIERSLLKDELGTRVLFQERNLTLGLAFSYAWSCADRFGIVREAQIESLGEAVELQLVDGVLNLLPSETPRGLQTTSSVLVDAYKWNELDADTRLATYSLYARISDRAEPAESLTAAAAYAIGLDGAQVYVAASDFDALRRGRAGEPQAVRRGVSAAYLLSTRLKLAAKARASWQIVLDTGLSQSEVVSLREQLRDPLKTSLALQTALAAEHDGLRDLLAESDAFQSVDGETTANHHVANTLFNVMRGGVFEQQYRIDREDYAANLRLRNRGVADAHAKWLATLPAQLTLGELLLQVEGRDDAQLRRLAREYLPLVFGRRHGDPSRPWNHFSIRGREDDGRLQIAYQGNWRDIFQNWEALLVSFPDFAPNIVAKFVNASTQDGYNPYRVDQTGIDWEVEEPDNPWANIGYWGDHQLIYLLRLLELCQRTAPEQLQAMLGAREFAYANVPYRIAGFAATLADPKHTVRFDHALEKRIEQAVGEVGSDAKLVCDVQGKVLLVTLVEKLLVPLLSKLGNLVPGGGIWLNTQRPEWNDANNALVGAGLSMVTLYHARRYTQFLLDLLQTAGAEVALSENVARWLQDTTTALEQDTPSSVAEDAARWKVFAALGESAERYRTRIYAGESLDTRSQVHTVDITRGLRAALATLDRSIAHNRRADGLYHAYNLLSASGTSVSVETLYPMLEGQVAVLASGVLDARSTAEVLDALFASDIYRADQHSFMLYPDPPLKSFLDKNRVPEAAALAIPVLREMLDSGDRRVIERDAEGCLRFAASLMNGRDLAARLAHCAREWPGLDEAATARILALYESVFEHHRFTGRSGTMFGFEGRGSIYWHMVSKLLLTVQESFFTAVERGEDEALCRRLGEHYFRVRAGIGFNKTPLEYGAFPCDPYSHTPGHAGAQQPGMTGQVKEEVIARFGELGIRVQDGRIHFNPALLSRAEFNREPRPFRYRDVDGVWREESLQAGELGFTLCQVPFIVRLAARGEQQCRLVAHARTGHAQAAEHQALTRATSAQLFSRSGAIRKVEIDVPESLLFGASA
ncbi:hypothetical protein [Niveibacterium sp. SC-1]|uniref:hypothetical protein n=1 Tax=Niveibacterium sp. SC-1 TaxID=3135646 RepID=UPI00311F4643